MARIKKVHSTEQLLHLFCNMVDADLEGFRNSQSNVYFQDGVLWSYGSHYPMAKRHKVGQGLEFREIILINSTKSSVTTEKHKSQLRQSVKPSQWTFDVPNIKDPRAVENREHLMNRIVDRIDHILRRHIHWQIEDVTRSVNHYNQFAKSFGFAEFSIPVEFYTDLFILACETVDKNVEREKKRALKQQLEREQAAKKYVDQIPLWYTCKNTMSVPAHAFNHLGYDPVRVRNNIVESPRGAEVPLLTAQEFCTKLMRKTVKFGDKLGPFTVEAIDDVFVTIGCHRINIKQACNAVLGAQ